MLMALGFVVKVNADDSVSQCPIEGAEYGSTATVTIESYDCETNIVKIGFYNDSGLTVTITAIVVSNGNQGKISVTDIVPPRSSVTKECIWIDHNCNPNSTKYPSKVYVQSAKCRK